MKKFIEKVLKFIKTLAILAILLLALYFVARVIVFSYSDYNIVEKIFGALLLIAEGFIALHSLGFLLGILRVSNSRDVEKFEFKEFPTVAVVVAARHEPRHILEKTFTTLRMLNYPNKNVYLLDDSSEENFKQEAREICEKYGATVFSREERHGAKAGIVNDFLRQMKEDYLVIFDADQNPMPNFLRQTLPYFFQDPKLAFVQTPQFYTNVAVSPIARGACVQQTIFYEYICEAKSSSNSMFCCGTNVLFKRKVLLEIGGFDETSITEDFATSIKVHMAGYHSVYHAHVAAFGMAPESLPAYFKQQARWATGSIQVFRKILMHFLKTPHSLNILQWWEYFLSGSFYFIGLAFFVLMISPILYLVFNIPTYFSESQVYLSVFIPYLVLSFLIFYGAMSSRKYKIADLYRGALLSLLSFPILMKSAFYGLAGKKVPFVITTKGKVEQMSFVELWPYHLMILSSLMAIIIGGFRFFYGGNPYALAVNIFWATYHLFILSHIYYFNKAPELKK